MLKKIKKFSKSTLKKYVEGKKVALVGPANYLNYFEFGPIIDSCDLTARVNRGIELVADNKKKVGSKTDILFNCLIEHNDNGGKLDFDELKKNNVTWICTIPRSDFYGNATSNKLSKGVNLLTLLKLKLFFNFHVFDYKSYNILNKKVKCRSNTGFSAIFDLLESGAKEIFITGFSFYMDSFMAGYKKGCLKDEDKFAEDCFLSIRHNQINQWKYLKGFKNHPNLSFDPVLQELLEKDDLNRKDFPEILKKVNLSKKI
tara:strand:+ start:2467 stop:3240 length:774 start_codon:yes stop_codon:yes gene_type:complete